MNVGDGHGAFPRRFVGKGAHGNQNTYQPRRRHRLARRFRSASRSTSTLSTASASPPEAPIPRSRAPGVTINLVTKRGTNRIAGSAAPCTRTALSGTTASRSGALSGRIASGSGAPGPATPTSARRRSCPTASRSEARRRTRHWNAKLTAQLDPREQPHARLPPARHASSTAAARVPNAPSRRRSTSLGPCESYKVEDSHVLSESLFAALSLLVRRRSNGERFPREASSAQADTDADYVWRNSYIAEHQRPNAPPGGTDRVRLLRHGPRCGTSSSSGSATGTRASSRPTAWPADQLVGLAHLGPRTGAGDARNEREGPRSTSTTPTSRTRSRRATSRSTSERASTISSPETCPPRFLRMPTFRSSCRPCSTRGTPPTRSPGARSSLESARPTRSARIGRRCCERRMPGSPTRWTWRSFVSMPFPESPLLLLLDRRATTTAGSSRPRSTSTSLVSRSNVDPDDPGLDRTRQSDRARTSSRPRRTSSSSASNGSSRPTSPFPWPTPTGDCAARSSTPLIGTTRASYRVRRKRRRDDHRSEHGVRPRLQRALLRPHDGSPAQRDRAPEPSRHDRDLRRPGAAASEILLERLDAARGLRLQQLAPASRRRRNRESEQRGSRRPTPAGRSWKTTSTRPGNSTSAALVQLPLAIQAGVNLFGRQGFPILYFVEVDHARHARRPPGSSRSDPRRTTEPRTSTSSTFSSRATSSSHRGSRSRRSSPASTCSTAAPCSPATAGSAGFDTEASPIFEPNPALQLGRPRLSAAERSADGVRISF